MSNFDVLHDETDTENGEIFIQKETCLGMMFNEIASLWVNRRSVLSASTHEHMNMSSSVTHIQPSAFNVLLIIFSFKMSTE